MKFYGVGTTMGGISEGERIGEYLDNDFWCMGYTDEEKPNYAKLIGEIKCGNILIAKAHYPSSDYYVKAIGIVSGEKTDSIPDEFKDKSGVSVIWFKRFEPPVHLTKNDFNLGGNRTHTIYLETDDKNISVIKEMMKFNYKTEA